MKISSPKAINWTLKQYGYRNKEVMRRDDDDLVEFCQL
jgi:hypothetical protein